MTKGRLGAVVFLVAIIIGLGWSFSTGGVAWILLDPDVRPEAKVEALRAFFLAWGPLAPLAYVAVVVIEAVVAPIPGAILYFPGGLVFGGFWGGTLSLIGNVVGAGVCCTLMRTIVGREWSRTFFTLRELSAVEQFILKHGVVSIALLRVNPLTSSDVVSYAAGLTTLPVWTVMTGTLIGMAPLCYLQAYLSVSLFTAFPWLIWPLIAGCVIYAVLVVIALRRMRQARARPAEYQRL